MKNIGCERTTRAAKFLDNSFLEGHSLSWDFWIGCERTKHAFLLPALSMRSSH